MNTSQMACGQDSMYFQPYMTISSHDELEGVQSWGECRWLEAETKTLYFPTQRGSCAGNSNVQTGLEGI